MTNFASNLDKVQVKTKSIQVKLSEPIELELPELELPEKTTISRPKLKPIELELPEPKVRPIGVEPPELETDTVERPLSVLEVQTENILNTLPGLVVRDEQGVPRVEMDSDSHVALLPNKGSDVTDIEEVIETDQDREPIGLELPELELELPELPEFELQLPDLIAEEWTPELPEFELQDSELEPIEPPPIKLPLDDLKPLEPPQKKIELPPAPDDLELEPEPPEFELQDSEVEPEPVRLSAGETAGEPAAADPELPEGPPPPSAAESPGLIGVDWDDPAIYDDNSDWGEVDWYSPDADADAIDWGAVDWKDLDSVGSIPPIPDADAEAIDLEEVVGGIDLPETESELEPKPEPTPEPQPTPEPIEDEVTEPYQTVSATSEEISFYPGKDVNFDLLYTTSDNESALTGLGLKVHYDSTIFTPSGDNNGVSALVDTFGDPTILDDTDNFDNDAATDKYLAITWTDFMGNFPGGDLPATLASLSFASSESGVDSLTGENPESKINFTSTAPTQNYDFLSQSVTLKPQSFNLDVDGDGNVTALGDGLMVIRKLFGAAFGGDKLTDKAMSNNATRTTEGIHDYIQAGIDEKTLDVDGDGNVTALGDGLMVIRKLFGTAFAGEKLTDKAISNDATRTTEGIHEYIAAMGIVDPIA